MKIGVIGVGTAGIMSLCHSLSWLCPDDDSTVTSIYDPNQKILGIGESMEPGFAKILFEGTGFRFLEDAAELDATLKLGVSWKNWRETDFTAVMGVPSYGIHFNNTKLKKFSFDRFVTKWGKKFQTIEGNVTSLSNLSNGAVVTVNDVEYTFDYIIDCRGSPKDFTDYTLVDIPTNHCLVYMINEPGNWNTTITQAHANGWMFGIPLSTRQGWGYLYNDKITSREDAVKDIERIFDKTNLKLNEFTFKSYYAKKFIDGRIIKNGNAAMFLEPLEALSGFVYEQILRYTVDYVEGKMPAEHVNQELVRTVIDAKNFINFAYHGGSTFDTEFWNKTAPACFQNLNNDRWIQVFNTVRSMSNGTNSYKGNWKEIGSWSYHHWQEWDKHLGYNYFK
jgi:hypothetical protein